MKKGFEGIIFFENKVGRNPILCTYSSHLYEMVFRTKSEMEKIKKDFPAIEGNLFIEICGMGVYLLQTK